VKFEQSDPGRKRLLHLSPLEFVHQTTILLITFCADKRRPLFARQEIVALLLESWRKADHWLVGRWVVMPDHLHLFCAPATSPPWPVESWARFWQNHATRHWPHPAEKPLWQRDFFDRRLRNGESYKQKWLYLWENPIKAGLVRKPEDWPYQGEINVLSWHEPG
jgi:putative transposase